MRLSAEFCAPTYCEYIWQLSQICQSGYEINLDRKHHAALLMTDLLSQRFDEVRQYVLYTPDAKITTNSARYFREICGICGSLGNLDLFSKLLPSYDRAKFFFHPYNYYKNAPAEMYYCLQYARENTDWTIFIETQYKANWIKREEWLNIILTGDEKLAQSMLEYTGYTLPQNFSLLNFKVFSQEFVDKISEQVKATRAFEKIRAVPI